MSLEGLQAYLRDRYLNPKPESTQEDGVDKAIEFNREEAKRRGISVEDLHKQMSAMGNEIMPVLVKKVKQKYVPQTATEYVLNQIFPNLHNND